MQALALPNEPRVCLAAAWARNQSDHMSPVNPSPPTRKTSRRLIPSHKRTLDPSMESMKGPPADVPIPWPNHHPSIIRTAIGLPSFFWSKAVHGENSTNPANCP